MKMVSVPCNAKEAYKAVINLAKAAGLSPCALCEEKGVSPATLTLWKTKRESYRIGTFLRFME